MSKQMGNFILLQESIRGQRLVTINGVSKSVGWTADSTRVALADGGDGLEDANFSIDVADGAIMRLYNETKFAEEVFRASKESAAAPLSTNSVVKFQEDLFAARIDQAIESTDAVCASSFF